MADVVESMREKGLIDSAAASRVKELLQEGKSIEEAVLSADGVSEEALLRFLADSFEIPFYTTEQMDVVQPSKDLLTSFPARLLLRNKILPIESRDGVVIVVTSRVSDTAPLDELRMVSGRDLTPALAVSTEIDRALHRVMGVGADTLQTLNKDNEGLEVVDDGSEVADLDAETAAQDASIITFVNQILSEAIELRATDVHIEPFEQELRLRYRVDGILVEANVPTSIRRFHPAIVSRVKILSHLDIAEKTTAPGRPH